MNWTSHNARLPSARYTWLAVISPDSGDGKSYTAANLAVALAQLGGGRTLLVDADMRRPTLSSVLGAAETAGVAELLRGGEAAPIAIEENLRFLSAGLDTVSGFRNVVVGSFVPVMDWCRSVAELVVVDSSPMSVAPDSKMIAEHVGGVVFVVSRSRFRGGAEGEFVEDLRDAGVQVLGSVVVGYRDQLLNQARQKPILKLLRLMGLLR